MNDVDWGGFENHHYDTYYIIVWADLKSAHTIKNRDAVSRVSIRIYNGKINYLTSQVSLVSRSSAKL